MRQRRMLQEGAEYHVTARINRSEMILSPREDKDLFLAVLRRAKKKFDFQIKNFCLMNNHVHFLIKPGNKESLSRIMQWILSVFAMAWNRKYHLTGHVWGERFFSRVIPGIVGFLRIFMYIDDNPVNAQIVGRPWEWEFGGLWHHRRGIRDITEEPEPFIVSLLPEHGLLPC
ncbi:MAG: transposase [Treponema sp.]|nr:transposase [Treponema sp.]